MKPFSTNALEFASDESKIFGMRRYAIPVAVVALLAVTVACGGVVFGYFTFSGTVSNVRIGITDGNQVTIVILTTDSGTSQTLNFCGNVMPRFSANSFVTVNYRQNGGCYTLVKVIYISSMLRRSDPQSTHVGEQFAERTERGRPVPTRVLSAFAVTDSVGGEVKTVL